MVEWAEIDELTARGPIDGTSGRPITNARPDWVQRCYQELNVFR